MADDVVNSILGNFESSVSGKIAPRDTFNTDAIVAGFERRVEPEKAEPVPELRQGKPEDESWYQETWRRLTQNTDEQRAKAANAMAISKEYNVSPSEAYARHDEFARESGLMGQPTNKEFLDKIMTGAVVAGLATHPLATVLGVSGFAALSESESYVISKLQGKKYRFGEQKGLADLDPEVSRDAATFLDIIDFVGKGAIVGGGMKGGKEWGIKADAIIKEKFLRDTFEEYKMPEKVFVSSEKMREFFGTGEKVTPEEYDMIQSLGLDAAGYKDALKYGIDIEIPAERLVRVVDKPWWGKLKESIGLNPYEEIRVEGGGGPVGKRPVAGLLEEGNVAEEAMRPFADILKDINEAFGETGAVAFNEGGLRNLTPEQIAARERLKRDFEVAKKKAAEAGEDISTFLKKMGIDEKVATYMVGEFGGETKGEEEGKEKQFINILVEEKPERVEVVSEDPMFEVDRTISEMAAAPYELGESPSYDAIRQKAGQIALQTFEKRVDIRKKREAALVRRHAEGLVQEDPTWALMTEVVKGGGLNLEALKKEYSADTVKELMRKRPGLIQKGGKYFLDTLAAEKELPSGDALMNQLLDLPLKDEMVQREIRAFEDAFGDELEADYSDLYVKMIDEEAKLMAQLTSGYKPRPSPGIKKVILEQTGKIRVGDLVGEYDALKAGMKKAERASREAWAGGKKEGAITEKLRQKEIAIKLRDRAAAKQEAKKLKDGLIKLLKTPVGKDALPPEYMDQVQELLGGYDLMPRGPKTARRIENLKDLLAKHEETGELGAAIANSLIDRVNKVPWKELTLDELRDLHDAAEMIVHLGKLKNKLLAAGEKRDLNTAISTVVNTIVKNYPQTATAVTEPLLREEQGVIDKLTKGLREYRSELLKPEYLFRRLDKFVDLGPVWETLFLPFNRAESVEYAKGDELTKRLLDAMAPFTKGIRGGAKWAHEKVKVPGVPKNMTKEQMIMVALNTGNEGNLNALRYGNKFTDAQIEAIQKALTPEETKFVETVWSIIDSMAEDLSGVYRKLTGARMRRVEGNYFPLMFDRELSWRADSFQAEAESRDFFKTIYSKPAVEKGFTKERTGGKLPVRLDFGVIFKHINDVNHYISHALPVRDVQRIVTNPAIRAAISDKMGKEYYDQLMPWLQEIAKPRQEPISKTEKVLDRIRSNATIVAMGFKISTALQQPLSLSQSFEELGMIPVMDAVSKFYVSIPTTVAFVNARSEMMANRMQHYDREVEALGKKLDPALDANLKQTYFLMMGVLDVASAYPTWTAAYKIGMERFGSDQKAVDYADMIVRKTQGTAAPKDLAPIQRGGSLKKLLTMFYTFFSSMQNQMMERGAQFGTGDKGVWDLMKAWWWLIIFPAVASDLIRRRMIDPPHEMAQSAISYRLGGLPVVRDIASGVLSDFDYQFSPVASAGIEMGKFGKELIKPVEGKRIQPGPLAKHGVQTLGYIYGVPTGQFLITAEGAIDLAGGKTKDPTVLLMKEQKKKK